MSLTDYQAKALPNFVLFCDMAHGFDELLVMADSRFNRNARNYYGSESADPELPVSWTVYRTLQVNNVTTVSQAESYGEKVIKARKTNFSPTKEGKPINSWEYKDSVSVFCPKCELPALSIDKKDFALWLDPLIDSGDIETGNKGDLLVSLASVWQQFEGVDQTTLRDAMTLRANSLK